MDNKQIKELMAAMARNGVKRLSVKNGDVEVSLEREGTEVLRETHYVHEGFSSNPMFSDAQQQRTLHLPEKAPTQAAAAPAQPQVETAPEKEGVYITSPMVGTFYTSPSPEDPPFIKVGDRVEKGQVVCIVEAMKVMNEVKSDHAGEVKECLLDSASPVEFGSQLFRIT